MNTMNRSHMQNFPKLKGRTVDDALTCPLADPVRNAPPAIVLAGVCNSKEYVSCEWILDKFKHRYSSIPTRKVPLLADEWPDFLHNLCIARGWRHEQSYPAIVYREVLGNPFLYIGNLESFRLYLNQLFHFKCDQIPVDYVEGYISDNQSEVVREREQRKIKPDPPNLWRVSIIVTNHLELIPIRLIQAIGERDIVAGRQVRLTIHNTTANRSRPDFQWTDDGIADYMDDNAHRLPSIFAVKYSCDLCSAVTNQDLIIILWSMRQEMQFAIEGRTYALRAGMSPELLTLICQEIHDDFTPIADALQRSDLTNTKILLTSSSFKTPLCALGTYLFQKLKANFPVSNLLVNALGIERSYRSVVAEEIRVRAVDITETRVWGNLGGTVMFDPVRATVEGHRGVIETPKGIKFVRPLLQVYSGQKQLQVEFAVDAPMRANYMEILESTRHSSILASETCIQILNHWHGTVPSPTSPLSLGVVTSTDNGPLVPPGCVIVLPVQFHADGTHTVTNETDRPEIQAILHRTVLELNEFLTAMKKFDPDLADLIPVELDAHTAIPEAESVVSHANEDIEQGNSETTVDQVDNEGEASSDRLPDQ